MRLFYFCEAVGFRLCRVSDVSRFVRTKRVHKHRLLQLQVTFIMRY